MPELPAEHLFTPGDLNRLDYLVILLEFALQAVLHFLMAFYVLGQLLEPVAA